MACKNAQAGSRVVEAADAVEAASVSAGSIANFRISARESCQSAVEVSGGDSILE